MLQGAPEGIAIDASQELYYTVTQQDLKDVALQHYGKATRIFQLVKSGSCITAIFQDKKGDIDRYCNYALLTNSLEAGIYHIRNRRSS